MKAYRSLEKTRTWVVLLLSILIPPVVVLGLPRSNAFDDYTTIVDRLHQRSEVGQHSDLPDITPQIQELERSVAAGEFQATGQQIGEVYGAASIALVGTSSTRAFETCVLQNYLPVIQSYARVTREGRVKPLLPADGTVGLSDLFKGPDLARTIDYSFASEMHRLAAFAAGSLAAEGRTTEALAAASDLLAIREVVPYSWRSSSSIVSVLLTSLRALSPEQETEPIEEVLSRDRQLAIRTPLIGHDGMPRFSPLARLLFGSFMERHLLNQVGTLLVQERGNFQREDNRKWAANLENNQRGRSLFTRRELASNSMVFPLWTITHLHKQNVERVLETEPGLTWRQMGDPELFAGMKPYSVAAFAYAWGFTSQFYMRGRAESTAKELVRVGCAAHEFRRKNHRWPEARHELPADQQGSEQTGGGEADTLFGKANLPFAPFELGLRELTTDTVLAYLGLEEAQADSRGLWQIEQLPGADAGMRRFKIELMQTDWNHKAFSAWLFTEKIAAVPGVKVTSSTVEFVNFDGSRKTVESAGEALLASPGAAVAGASPCREQLYQSLAGVKAPAIGYSHGSYTQTWMRTTVDVPEKAFAIWSNGPDGKPGNSLEKGQPDRHFHEDSILFLW